MATSMRSCPACGAKNRIPVGRLADVGRCGKCAASLPAQASPVDVDAATFDVLVDFWAPWCGPCRMAAPEVERAAKALQGEAIVVKVNTDEEPQLAARYGVRGIPMCAVIDGGQMVAQQTGLVDARRLVSMVQAS